MENKEQLQNEEQLQTGQVVKNEEQPDGGVVKTKTRKILLEILVYGERKDKDKIKKLLDNLQEQLLGRKARHRARILWYIDEGEKNKEEKMEWFNENMNCKYYVYAHEENKFYVDKKFVSETLLKIKKFEDSYVKLKTSGVQFNKNKNLESESEKNEDTR